MIQMHIQNEKDLYDAYDPSMSRINEDAFRYLKSFFTEKESKKHINDTLQIISDKLVQEKKESIIITKGLNQKKKTQRKIKQKNQYLLMKCSLLMEIIT